jgi:hypothetical protein
MFEPFGSTSSESLPWQSEPTFRGTYAILSSCVVTIILCVWTAVHLNVPAHKESLAAQQVRKFGWVILGLIAPEMVRS